MHSKLFYRYNHATRVPPLDAAESHNIILMQLYAMVLGKLQGPGRPTNLDYSRARVFGILFTCTADTDKNLPCKKTSRYVEEQNLPSR